MEIPKTPYYQSSLRKKKKKPDLEESGFLLQTTLQSCSNQNSIVLAQKQKYRSINRDKPTDLWLPNL